MKYCLRAAKSADPSRWKLIPLRVQLDLLQRVRANIQRHFLPALSSQKSICKSSQNTLTFRIFISLLFIALRKDKNAEERKIEK